MTVDIFGTFMKAILMEAETKHIIKVVRLWIDHHPIIFDEVLTSEVLARNEYVDYVVENYLRDLYYSGSNKYINAADYLRISVINTVTGKKNIFDIRIHHDPVEIENYTYDEWRMLTDDPKTWPKSCTHIFITDNGTEVIEEEICYWETDDEFRKKYQKYIDNKMVWKELCGIM